MSDGTHPIWLRFRSATVFGGFSMPRKYSPSASKDVEREMHKFKRGELKRGKRGKGGTVKNRKQAIAIALSEARKKERKFRKKGTASRVAAKDPLQCLLLAQNGRGLGGRAKITTRERKD
jgi:uncharacterized protein DUF6496